MVTDPIIWARDQGRSKIHDGRREGEVAKPSVPPPVTDKPPVDSFEKTFLSADEAENNAGSSSSNGLRISYHFDLFYELSQKVSAKMGQKGLNRFTEVSAGVAETFKGSFSLKIDALGSFLNGTDKSLNISPETANRFMDSVAGLADLSPESLEQFLSEADSFFADLEATYGEADGAFDDIRDQMKSQANQFFDSVAQIRNEASGEAQPPEIELPDALLETSAKLASEFPLGFIPLSDGSGMEFPARDYKSFLSNFLKYVEQFRKNTMKDFLASLPRPTGAGKPMESPASPVKEAVFPSVPVTTPAHPTTGQEPQQPSDPAVKESN